MTPPAATARATAPARAPSRAPAPVRRPVRPAPKSPRHPAPAPQQPRHLDVVRGSSVPGRRPPRPMMWILAAATGFALFALVTVNVFLGQTGIVRAELQNRVIDKRTAVEEASLDVMQLRSPSRIAARARALGLVPASAAIVLATPSTVRGPSPVRGRP